MTAYLDYSGRDDVLGGGAQRIPVDTPKGTYHVWVKRTGNNPRLRVLLLHGGPDLQSGSKHGALGRQGLGMFVVPWSISAR